jgi:hypothetical protein
LSYRPALAVHFLLRPDFAEREAFQKALFAHLYEDPEDLGAHGLRIPVQFWTDPAYVDLKPAARRVVIMPLDAGALADSEWIRGCEEIAAALDTNDLLLPIALSPAVLEMSSPLTEFNFIRLHQLTEDLRLPVFLNRVTHALCRLIGSSQDPVKVFLSHAKSDGMGITRQVRNFLQEGSGVQNFFDAQDIPDGSRWRDVIHNAARERNVLLAIRTDDYASREWCRTEILDAKIGGSALVVLDALESMEARGFPYLGNAPSVRWQATESRLAMESLLGVLLKQVLRFRYFPLRIADLCGLNGIEPPAYVMPAPPELLTVLRAQRESAGNNLLVYPDPPLGSEELGLVSEFAPDIEPVTPNALLAAI